MNAPRLKTSAMIASIAAEGQRTVAAPFGTTLARLAETRADIVGLSADLARYTDLHVFAAAHPDRFYQMGMAEQLLFGAAAGFAREGFTPFATTYAVFAARRAYDFIYMAICEDRLNVKIACALPGLTTGYGPSHQATEDLAIFRAVPNLTIIDPCDALERPRLPPPSTAPSTCASCAAGCRSSSTSMATASRSGGRSCCATARTCCSCPRAF
jgi:transketolase